MNKCSLISRLFLLLSLLLVHLSLLPAQTTPPKQLILVVKGDIAPYSIAIDGFETVLVESGIPVEMKTFRYTD
ncbi:MAG: hypothetical protein GY757_21200, partial [bacterium]|nr:hypothetical protein [bacterium]